MFDLLIISIGLVLIIEGSLYFFLANRINLVINILQDINPKKIKNISVAVVFIGFCLIYFIIRPYL